MRGTPSPVPTRPAAGDAAGRPAAPTALALRARARTRPAPRARRAGTAGLVTAVLTGLVAGLLSAAAAAPALASLPQPVAPRTVLPGPAGGDATSPGVPEPGHEAQPLATVEDEEAWCSYLSSHYLAFPSPWSARVYNCHHTAMFVAPVFSNGTVGMCVLVPARHSRHLGGNVGKWVTDIRVC